MSAKKKMNRAGRAHRSGMRKGYEDCAIFVDGIGAIWGAGIKPGHELVEEVLTDVAKQIRLLKEII